MKRTINLLQEFSIPLIAGVLLAIAWANINPEGYAHFLHYPFFGHDFKILGHELNFHFLFNDIFMVFFFGIAAVEITQSVLPGGSLNPISKAVNPLMGTLGGVIGPVGVFFLLCYVLPMDGLLTGNIDMPTILNGWGIPTATDIALAWLVARLVFGNKHPAVSYLLLLAVADDAIGLGIIAIFYPDPNHPVEVYYLGLTLLGMAISFGLNKMNVKNMWLYLITGGLLSWLGLIMAHLHPALALVFIVPFMPADKDPSHHHDQLFDEEQQDHSTLVHFEHSFKLFVDFGLLGFGIANAGVVFSNINNITWIILASLLIGKTIGITLFGYGAHLAGSKLPDGMNIRTLIVAGVVAGLGLTVALFVAGEAYTDLGLQGAAKMGALFSAAAAVVALILGKVLAIKKID
ncbi:MAG: sodium:proton antiporter [Acidobacteria bacterium]|nr:MAG: sodium:proton antiporter [Acidobacteriota bacterium]